MKITAELNYLRMAPRKVRAVARAIRGKNVREAEVSLQFLARRAAGPMAKLLRSAVANARQNFQVTDPAALRVSEISVDQGPALKRIRPRAFGRAFPIRKETSHITLVLEAHGVAPRRRRRAKPAAVRMATEEANGARTEGVIKPAPEREAFRERPKAKTKPTEFVRRMFRRKAI